MSTAEPKCLVVATATNDAPFLLEWVAHWQLSGADALLVYSHDSSDSTAAMLGRLAALGHVIHERLPEGTGRPRRAAFDLAPKHPAYAQADWVLPVQTSDFCNIRLDGQALGDLIGQYGAADAIALPVRRFATGGPFRDDLQIAIHRHGEPVEQMNDTRRRTLFLRASMPQRIALRAPDWAEGKEALTVSPDAGEAAIHTYPRRAVVSEEDGKRWPRDNSLAPRLDALVDRLTRFHQDQALRRLHEAAAAHHAGAPRRAGAAAAPVLPSDTRLKAPYRYTNRRKMLASLPKGGRCAEVGVWQGAFSADILDVTEPRELVLIDPWDLVSEAPKDTHTHHRLADQEFMARMHGEVVARFANLPNVTIRKGFSEDVLASYPDDYFDWVYIDGNHLYDFVRRDVELSFRKVRPGGIIAGDDFTWEMDGRAHVREAVIDALQARGRSAEPQVMGAQYLITVDK